MVRVTLHELPPDATHWSAERLAGAVGIGHGAAQKIWAATLGGLLTAGASGIGSSVC